MPLTMTSVIIAATKPLDRPFSPASQYPDEASARIRLEDFVSGDVLRHILELLTL